MKEYRLIEIADVIMGQSPSSSSFNDKGDGLPFLQGNRTFGRKYPTFDTYTTNPTKLASAGDVVMSVRAPVGDLNITPVNMCLGRGVCAIRMKNNNQEYLFYLLRHYMPQLLKKESGTVFGSVNRNDIGGLIVNIHEEKDQVKIAKFLAQIDEKIENNCRINDNLQQQVFALFDNLFPNIAYGEKLIGDYITPKRGKNLLSKDAVSGEVPVVAGGLNAATYHNVANTTAPVVTISASGANAGFINLWHIPVWSSDSSYIDFSITSDVLFWYVLLKKRQKEIYDSQTGSAQPHIYPQHIAEMRIKELNMSCITEYVAQVTPLFTLMGKNLAENRRLCAIRDSLLPKLMSGEIDVYSVEI